MITTAPPPDRTDAESAPVHRVLGVLADGVVDTQGALRKLQHWVADTGARADIATGMATAKRKLSESSWDMIFLMLGEQPVAELDSSMVAIHDVGSPPKVVALASHPSMETVVHAEQLGVNDVLRLPLRREDVMRMLSRPAYRDDDEPVMFPEPSAGTSGRFALVGEHASMLEIYRLMARAAPTNAAVMLVGEEGTGRETIARSIHEHSAVERGPWVVVHCAAVPEEQLEMELFGQAPDAAPGGATRHVGRFEQADGGTIFLNDISALSAHMQARLLRAVQDGIIERAGGDDVVKVDVRIVSSSSRDLRRDIADGRFRGDLYYRLAIVIIRVPRLKDREGDLLPLVAHFARHFARLTSPPKEITGISHRALRLLEAQEWPGNVRELRNVIERATIVARDSTIRLGDLPDELQTKSGGTVALGAPLPSLAEIEARHIARVLEHTGGVIHTAAAILGIHRNTLARKVKEYHL